MHGIANAGLLLAITKASVSEEPDAVPPGGMHVGIRGGAVG
jgi:hypothetical protein